MPQSRQYPHRRGRVVTLPPELRQVNLNAAGIDIGAEHHYVAVPERRESLAAATAIYLPDPERATAGIHFGRMLRVLQLHDQVAPRLRPYPSGMVAMAALAQCPEPGSIGCTQVTEINATPGVKLVGPLPGEFDLATVYAVGMCAQTRQPALARRFAHMVYGPESLGLRVAAGFEL